MVPQQLNDLKYNMLAPGVWYDCECSAAAKANGGRSVRAQFSGGLCRCKSLSAAYPWSPPLGHTAEEVRDDGLPFWIFVFFLDLSWHVFGHFFTCVRGSLCTLLAVLFTVKNVG